MLVTEEQAKEMWCPEARHDGDGNRWGMTNHVRGLIDNPPECRCIASKCMYWRWAGWRIEEAIPRNATKDWIASLHPNRPKNDPTAVRFGYCGIAGKP